MDIDPDRAGGCFQVACLVLALIAALVLACLLYGETSWIHDLNRP